LVIHGTEDPLVPYPNGEGLAREIPGARLVTLPGCGHMPMWECPDALVRELSTVFAAAC
jgi:pimeloyl-ACP methyl ester carboxylesterase